MEEPQFDSTLGGAQDLPHSLHLPKFIAHRSQEIQIMRKTLASQASTKLAFQTLPKHMRRRAMSHNVKRLPRRLRQIHINQMRKSGTPTETKRPCRKFRRRPNNLVLEYMRRGATHRWLKTHVWHAKRFHMVSKWGYKIPCHPREKSFRACYRAVTNYCLLQDVSYVSCVEISASNDELIAGPLKKVTRTGTNLTIGAKTFISGCRECKLVLFNSDSEIGTVYANWCPKSNENISKLWLWIHAAFYTEALSTLCNIYGASAESNGVFLCETTQVTLRELRDDLSRFKLVGPTSLAVLKKSLLPLQTFRKGTNWLELYADVDKVSTLNAQSKVWMELNVQSDISPHYIYSIIVQDPRCKQDIIAEDVYEVCESSSISPLWEQQVRDCVNKEETLASKKIVEERKKMLVPGIPLAKNDYYVPVIVIEQPGCEKENLGFGAGFDIILPSSWSRHFWNTIIMNGARVGGWRECKNLLFEMGKTQMFTPNSEAGRKEQEETTNMYKETFYKKPPNKRINYNKFNIVKPYEYDWKLLLKEWSDEEIDNFVVIDKKSTLEHLQQWLNGKKELPVLSENSLVPVSVTCQENGIPKEFSIICLPKPEDGKSPVLEPKVNDKNYTKRKILRIKHKTLLKKLRKERRTNKKCINLEQQDILEMYRKEMKSLWLPPSDKLRFTCKREIMGVVEKGGFRYSIGKPCGIGYITATSLLELEKLSKRNRVLMRNTNSRHYHFAQLGIIVE